MATKLEIESISLSPKDHRHFTNNCCLCLKDVDDNEIKAIKIERNSVIDMTLYIESDYACHSCLINKVGYFNSQMKI